MSQSCDSCTTRRHVSRRQTEWRKRPGSRYRPPVRSSLLPLAALTFSVACSSESGGGKKQEKSAEPERKLAGVFPDRFKCESIVKIDELKQLLGAVDIQATDTPVATTRGLAPPCEYRVTMQSEMQGWRYDFDCRDNFKQTADALFEQYKQQNLDLQHQFDIVADAGIKPTDAGVPIKRVDDAVEVAVGARGLDHQGQAIIFVDDDAPCYVRVFGRDAAKRPDLAKLIAKNLTFMNAPMMPRAAPH
jgi:hypothetical protein